MALNLRQSHRATTSLRAAFMCAKLPSIEKADSVMPTWEKICNSADRGMGLFSRPNVMLNVKPRTFQSLLKDGSITV